MELPRLVFKYAYPLDDNRRRLYKRDSFGAYPSIDGVLEEVNVWRGVWKDFNKQDRIVKEIVSLTGITYPRDIEVYVIGAGMYPMSIPFIVTKFAEKEVQWTKNQKIEVLVHELLHRFVGDVEAIPMLSKYWEMTAKKYSQESDTARYHIIVYAILIKIFNKFMPEVKVEDFINKEWEDYVRAAELAREVGVDEIINEFRKLTS